MDAKSACLLLAHLGLAVISLALITAEPAGAAPLALRVQAPMDDPWWSAGLPPRPTEPVMDRAAGVGGPRPPPGGDADDDDEDDDGEAGGKQGKPGDEAEPGSKLRFRGMDLPRKFNAYDLDRSRGVSLSELSAVTETDMTDAREPFEAADVDGNQVLSPEEFTQAPWIFDAGGITLIDSAQEPEDEPAVP